MEWKWPMAMDHWRFKLLGPTTVHLRHEFYLLLVLVFLAISSLQSSYRSSVGSWGDFLFLLVSTLWLARHLLVRWLCTRDIATTRSPTVPGLLVFWLTSHFMAGQYFDRPNPPVVARQLGTSHTDDARIVATISSFLPPSILFMLQLVRVRIWFPILALYEQLWSVISRRGKATARNASNGKSGGQRKALPSASLGINQAYSYWNGFWSVYGLPLQFIIPLFFPALYAWHFSTSISQTEATYALTMNTRNLEEEAMQQRAHGGYRKLQSPTMLQLFFNVSVWSMLATGLLYGRVVLPFPDLVAGSNVLKAVRNEAKVSASQSNKSSKSKAQKENADVPWAEQARSIIAENRFRLICRLAFVRLVEALIICVILPKTAFVCRFAGHCPDGLSIPELSKIFFPVGITSTVRTDTMLNTESAYITTDRGVTLIVVMSVIVATVSLLLAQAATSNRSYLGIMGYIAGGWTVVDNSDPSIVGSTPSQWDPRRRYKKGDLIVQNYPGFGSPTIYKATSNSPEGRPLDLYLRATHDLFRNELGHPATSDILAYTAMAHLGLTVATILFIACYQIMGYSYGSLLWALAANLLAGYGILSTATPNYSELESLTQQISG